MEHAEPVPKKLRAWQWTCQEAGCGEIIDAHSVEVLTALRAGHHVQHKFAATRKSMEEARADNRQWPEAPIVKQDYSTILWTPEDKVFLGRCGITV